MSINPTATSAASLANLLKKYQLPAASSTTATTATAGDQPATPTRQADSATFSPEALQALRASYALQMLQADGTDSSPASSSFPDTSGVPNLLASLGLGTTPDASQNFSFGQDSTTTEDPLTSLMNSYTASIAATNDRAIQAALARAGKTA